MLRDAVNKSGATGKVLLTVVIPTYNRLDHLLKVLQGLEKQTVKDFKVIVSDDASMGNVQEGLSSFTHTLPLQYLRNPVNGGRASACNLGLKAVATPLVAFLDDDLIPKPGWLKAHLDFHEKHPEENYATYGRISWGPLLKKSDLLRYLETKGRYKNCSCHDHGEVMWDLPTGNTSFKTSFLKDNGGFNADFKTYGQEDLEFGKRLFKKGLVCQFNSKAFAIHLHDMDLPHFMKLSEADGYSAAYFQSLDPDFKWYQSNFFTDWMLCEPPVSEDFLIARLETEKEISERENIYEALSGATAYKGMERFFLNHFPEFEAVKNLSRKQDYDSLKKMALKEEIQDKAVLLSILVFILEKKAGLAAVIPVYEIFLNRFPHFINARRRLCEILNETGNQEGLRKYFDSDRFKGHPEIELFGINIRLQMWLKNGEYEKAKNCIRQILRERKEWEHDRYYVHDLLRYSFEAKDYEKAFYISKKEKHLSSVHFQLGSVLEKEGDLKRARSLFEKVDTFPGNLSHEVRGAAAFHLGQILMKSDAAKAIEYFEKTLALIPEHGKAREHLNTLKGQRM